MALNLKSGIMKKMIIGRRIRLNEDKCVVCGGYTPEGRMVCYGCEYVEPSSNVIDITVLFGKITDIKDFVDLTTKCRDDVVVKSGKYVVDAKSIMGLFSLDLSKPLKVEFYGNIPNDVADGMRKFIID